MAEYRNGREYNQLSTFIADGDGDFASGTALPSNISLYDVLAGANGIPTAFPTANLPAAGVNRLQS